MKVVSSECIILKHQDFRESDRLVNFLARDKGRMAGIARGARKLTARGLSTFEPFLRGTIFYTEKPGAELVSIRKCDPVPPYLQLGASQAGYDKFLYASYFTELVTLCRIGPQEAEPFFLLLAGGLENLQGAQLPELLPLLRLDYELDFLNCLGLQPQWGRCCACDRPLLASKAGRPQPLLGGMHQFDVSLGGLRCPDCRAGGHALTDFSAGSLAFLAAWRDGAARSTLRPTRNALAELEIALTRHIAHHLEREPRSLALLPRAGGPGSV